jgi:hypothetical protein
VTHRYVDGVTSERQKRPCDPAHATGADHGAAGYHPPSSPICLSYKPTASTFAAEGALGSN